MNTPATTFLALASCTLGACSPIAPPPEKKFQTSSAQAWLIDGLQLLNTDANGVGKILIYDNKKDKETVIAHYNPSVGISPQQKAEIIGILEDKSPKSERLTKQVLELVDEINSGAKEQHSQPIQL